MRVKNVLAMLYEVAIREVRIASDYNAATHDDDDDLLAYYYYNKITWLYHKRHQLLRETNEDFIRGECLELIPLIRDIAEEIYSWSYEVDPYLHDSTYELLEYLDKIEKNIRGGKTK